MNAAKHFGFKHPPAESFIKNFFMDIGFGRPNKPGGYRNLTLLDVVKLPDYENGAFEMVTPKDAREAWNGSNAPIARQRAVFASLRHDIAYTNLRNNKLPYNYMHPDKRKAYRLFADRQFACDMYYLDNQPFWLVLQHYYSVRMFGGKYAKTTKRNHS